MKVLILILSLVFITGCSTITYESKDGKFIYTRIGTQSLDGLNVSRDELGNLKVSLEKSQGDSGNLAEALANMSGVAKSLAK